MLCVLGCLVGFLFVFCFGVWLEKLHENNLLLWVENIRSSDLD